MHVGKTKQIISDIKLRIKTGQWHHGFVIPSQRELALQYGVNRSTIVEVIEILKCDGLLETRGRQGTVVLKSGWSLVASEKTRHWGESIDSGFYQANQPTIQAINRLEFDSRYIRLGTGELSPLLYPKDEMEDILSTVGSTIQNMGYECPKGSLDLRQAVSDYLKGIGIEASCESILIVSGSLQALQLISIGLMSPDSRLFTESPSYVKSLNTFQSVGIGLEGVPLDQEGISLDHLLKALVASNSLDNVLYTIPTFHNPTGRVMSELRRKALLKFCAAYDLPIIEDDAYRELWLDTPPPSPLKAMDDSGNVLYLGTVSKSLAAGFRIGWVVGPESVISRLGDIKMQLDYGASSISQAIVAQCLKTGFYARNLISLRKQLRDRRQLTLDLLEMHYTSIATWEPPIGGFYIWLKLKSRISSKILFKKALEKMILINPGDIYDYEKNDHLRISYAYASEEELNSALPILAEIIKSLI